MTDNFDLDYFRKKPLPWLRTYLQEKGIQSSSDGKNKRKAELADLAYNATAMKLPKVMDGDSEDRNSLLRVILSTPEGALPLPESILTWIILPVCLKVTFPDICNFLLGKSDGHDEYSEGNLKSFKSLLGYRLFRDGHVLDQQLHKVPGKSFCMVKCKVKPTEKSKTTAGKDSYNGLSVIKSNGSIHGAFCECQGGADGSCRHIAAALFDLEFTAHSNAQQSSTSQQCIWKKCSRPNENASRLVQLNIEKSEYGKENRKPTRVTDFDPRSKKEDPKIFLASLQNGLQEIKSAAVVCPLLPRSAPIMVPEEDLRHSLENDPIDHEEVVTAVELLTVMEKKDIFLKEKGLNCDSEVTGDLVAEFMDFIRISKDQALMIFDKTVQQGDSDLWLKLRCGRLTASNFYRICHLRDSTSRENILKDLLMYKPLPEDKRPVQFEWGHAKETAAVELYVKKLRKKHRNLSVVECGLVVDPEISHLGTSPDRMRYCKCCGKVVVEVKSLYSKRSLMPRIAAAEYLYKENGSYKLKKETRWYYQIQGEMALSKVKNADLIIYTNKGIEVVRVPYDEAMWADIRAKLDSFYLDYMVPEILTGRVKKLLL